MRRTLNSLPIETGLKTGLLPHYFLSTKVDARHAEFLETFSSDAIFGAISNKALIKKIYTCASDKSDVIAKPETLPICIKVGFQDDLLQHGFSLRHIIFKKHLIESGIYKAFNQPNQALVLIELVIELLKDIDKVLDNENSVLAWAPVEGHFIFAAKSRSFEKHEHVFCTFNFDGDFRLVIGTLYSIPAPRFNLIKQGKYARYKLLNEIMPNELSKLNNNADNTHVSKDLKMSDSYAVLEQKFEEENANNVPNNSDPSYVQAVINNVVEVGFQTKEACDTELFYDQISDLLCTQEKYFIEINAFVFKAISDTSLKLKRIAEHKTELEKLSDKKFTININDLYISVHTEFSAFYKDNMQKNTLIYEKTKKETSLVNNRSERIKEIFLLKFKDTPDVENKRKVILNRLHTMYKLIETHEKLHLKFIELSKNLNAVLKPFGIIYIKYICDFLSFSIKNTPEEALEKIMFLTEHKQHVELYEFMYEVKDTNIKEVCEDSGKAELYKEFTNLSEKFLAKYKIKELIERSIQDKINESSGNTVNSNT